ncbi:hypothetical protein C0991_002981, partial [Blastosporella zonata]
MAPKITQQLPPGLQTRAQNKGTHPGVTAGLDPKPRRTSAQAKVEHERKEQEKHDKKEKIAQSKLYAATIKDQIQVPTFKPPPKNPKKNTLQPNDSSPEPTPKRVLHPHANTKTRYTSPMRLDDNDEYRPPAPMDKNNKEDSDNQENDITDWPQDVNLSVSSRCKPRRNDITALRITDVASGKRVASVVPEPPSNKKPKLTKKKTNTFNDSWDLKRRTAVVIPAPEFMVNDNSMAQYGGFVGDNEDNTAERISVRVAGPV